MYTDKDLQLDNKLTILLYDIKEAVLLYTLLTNPQIQFVNFICPCLTSYAFSLFCSATNCNNPFFDINSAFEVQTQSLLIDNFSKAPIFFIHRIELSWESEFTTV